MKISADSKPVRRLIDLTDTHEHAPRGESDRRSRPNTTVVVENITPIRPLRWGQPQLLMDAWRATCLTAGGWPGQSTRTSPMCTPTHNGAGLPALPTRDTPWPDPRPGTRPMYDESRAVGLGGRGPLAATTVRLHRKKTSHWPNPEDHHRFWTPQRLDNV